MSIEANSMPSAGADSAVNAWQAFCDDRIQRRDNAPDEASRAHFEAELEHARITMAAMGVEVDTAGGESPETVGENLEAGEHPEAGEESLADEALPVPDEDAFASQDGANGLALENAEGIEFGPGFPQELEPYQQHIAQAAEASGVPENLIAAVIWDESRGVLDASSTNPGNGLTDVGLMQVNPDTFAELQQKYPELLGDSDLSDPATNIMAGALYLAEQKMTFGDWETALRAYNSGPNNVNPDDLSDISKTGTGTSNYVDKVMDYMQTISNGGELPA